MARTKQTARRSLGSIAPRKQLQASSQALPVQRPVIKQSQPVRKPNNFHWIDAAELMSIKKKGDSNPTNAEVEGDANQ
ncbi:hypothetical protein GYMLUDRAFT_33625 [Collybiopsis luxurians FD-317 M1]|nr:hypothetical protein GYMLUDRAFT_33625 [Collybiopsis luxurians FD-317 M1]